MALDSHRERAAVKVSVLSSEFGRRFMKMLIVDDHRGMREMLKSLLCSTDDQAILCADGSEALAAYERHRPDWVLMDIAMKELDGITATRRIKQSFPDARILIITEHGNPRTQEMATEAGACGFVAKDNLLEVFDLMNLPRPSSLPTEPPSANHNA